MQPSSLTGPPPLKAIAKAIVASTDIYTPPQPQVPLNSFYLPKTRAMLTVGLSLAAAAVFANSSDDYLKRQFPSQVLELRNKIGADLVLNIWNGLVVVHLAEGAYALLTCLRRGWYSPLNTIKWTLSAILFGVGSLKQLKKHANDVAGLKSE